jgi:hypothetical protein
MNEFDKENLEFFMRVDPTTLAAWFEWADDQNIEYALRLIRAEITRSEMSRLELLDTVEDTEDADYAILEILSKFDTK